MQFMAFQVENLENLKQLRELYLGTNKKKRLWKFYYVNSSLSSPHFCVNSGKNKITKMEGMETLTDLKILSIQVYLALVESFW